MNNFVMVKQLFRSRVAYNGNNFTGSIFLCLMLLAGYTPAQTSIPVQFESLSINNGLSQGFVSGILQDKRGLMWFTTGDGLNKYDGSIFTVYHHDPEDSTSIGSDDLTCVFEDSKERLWIGTRNNGLDLFDREHNVFIHFRHTGPNSLRSDNILGIAEDKTGALWIRTRKGINRLEVPKALPKHVFNSPAVTKTTFRFTPIQLDSTTEASRNKFGAEKLFIDSRNRVIITTNNSLWEVIYNTALNSYRLSKQYSYPVNDSTFTPDLLEDPFQRSLLLNRGEIIQFPQLDLHSPRRLYQYTPYQVCWTIDKKGQLWLADEGRLLQFDLKTNQLRTLVPSAPLHLPILKAATVFYTDRTGVVWLASGGYGILKYDPEKDLFHHILPQFNAYQLLASGPGKIISNAFEEISIKKNQPVSVNKLVDPQTIKKSFRKLA